MAWWIFQNLVITTVLAAAVALVCRAGRIGPVARHALWVLVLVKFITPPVVVWPWAAPDPFALAAPDSPATRTDVRSIEPGFSAPIEAVAVVGERMTPSIGLVENPRATAHAATPVWPWLIGLWALGSAFILGIEVFRLVRLTRRVRSMPGDHPVARRVQALAAQLEIRPVSVDIVKAFLRQWCGAGGVRDCFGQRRSTSITPMLLSTASSCTSLRTSNVVITL
jgi:hypothetical protein